MKTKPFIISSSYHLSIVTPVYGCRGNLESLYSRLCKSVEPVTTDFEIIMVDDASPDGAWDCISSLAAKDKRVKGIRLSRNFGQHYAITAGLDHAKGDWVVVMDCDLQDQPEEIPRLYRKVMEGYDYVVAERVERQDSFFKKLSSKLFYKVYNYFTDANFNSNVANFGIYSAQVISNVKMMREQNQVFGLFVLWSGFHSATLSVAHGKRETGKSSYNLHKLVSLAMDSIISHSNKPLKLFIKLGFLLSFFSILFACWLVVKYLLYGVPVTGWTSLMVSIYFLAGLLLGSVGMVGIYIGKIFDEVKGRALYIVKDVTWNGKIGKDLTDT